jgi:hypothetical protein
VQRKLRYLDTFNNHSACSRVQNVMTVLAQFTYLKRVIEIEKYCTLSTDQTTEKVWE